MAAAAPASPAYPANTVLMLVAPWCAPCHGEVAQVGAIAAAAEPRDVRILMVEDGPRARAMLRGTPPIHVWQPAPADVRTVRASLMARTGGLPYSVVTDRRGQVCAEQSGGLDPARVRLLIARCR